MRPDVLSKRLFLAGCFGLPWLWCVHVLYWYSKTRAKARGDATAAAEQGGINSEGLLSADSEGMWLYIVHSTEIYRDIIPINITFVHKLNKHESYSPSPCILLYINKRTNANLLYLPVLIRIPWWSSWSRRNIVGRKKVDSTIVCWCSLGKYGLGDMDYCLWNYERLDEPKLVCFSTWWSRVYWVVAVDYSTISYATRWLTDNRTYSFYSQEQTMCMWEPCMNCFDIICNLQELAIVVVNQSRQVLAVKSMLRENGCILISSHVPMNHRFLFGEHHVVLHLFTPIILVGTQHQQVGSWYVPGSLLSGITLNIELHKTNMDHRIHTYFNDNL